MSALDRLFCERLFKLYPALRVIALRQDGDYFRVLLKIALNLFYLLS